MVAVSFEFFPPRDAAAEPAFWTAIDRLAPLAPRFVSVTYGADGSSRDRTSGIVSRLVCEKRLAGAPHLTCVGADRSAVLDMARRYWEAGIRHIVALRGDSPRQGVPFMPHPDGFSRAADLVAGLRTVADFEISVAAYPETHPESPNAASDLDNLKRKCEAGATQAITQFFFEPEIFLRFRDACVRHGIRVPLVPGILPVQKLGQLRRFAARCGASVPDWLVRRFEGLEPYPEARELHAASIALELVARLRREGVDQFHFYTLNRADPVRTVCRALELRVAA